MATISPHNPTADHLLGPRHALPRPRVLEVLVGWPVFFVAWWCTGRKLDVSWRNWLGQCRALRVLRRRLGPEGVYEINGTIRTLGQLYRLDNTQQRRLLMAACELAEPPYLLGIKDIRQLVMGRAGMWREPKSARSWKSRATRAGARRACR